MRASAAAWALGSRLLTCAPRPLRRFVFDVGAGCGVGVGYGFGAGMGKRWDQMYVPPSKQLKQQAKAVRSSPFHLRRVVHRPAALPRSSRRFVQSGSWGLALTAANNTCAHHNQPCRPRRRRVKCSRRRSATHTSNTSSELVRLVLNYEL